MKYTPHPHQLMAQARIVRDKQLAAFIDMGLGKTVATLSAFWDLYAGLEVRGMLVVAPLRVVEMVWPDEIAKWDHLRHLTISVVRGTPVARNIVRGDKLLGAHEVTCQPKGAALAALAPGYHIYATNYENLPALCAWMRAQKELPFDMVVFDESSKMKSASAKRFKAMKPLLRRFRRRLLLTGTPSPNGLMDLWAQIYLLDEGARLGDYVTHYKDRYFDTSRFSYEVKPKAGAAERVQAKISDLVLCMRSEDYLSLPPVVTNDIKVPFPARLRKLYDKFRNDLAMQINGMTVEAFNAASLSTKCRQFTSGAVYESAEPGAKPSGRWEELHDEKLEALASIIEESGGEPVLVCYEFKHELARLCKRFPQARTLGSDKGGVDTLAAWNKGKIQLLLVHPASVGHGLNLQAGGHILVWTSGTWNADNYAQMTKRLHRQGQERPVLVHRLLMPGTVDDLWTLAVEGKLAGQGALLDALKTHATRR